jgi:hypothetical protein
MVLPLGVVGKLRHVFGARVPTGRCRSTYASQNHLLTSSRFGSVVLAAHYNSFLSRIEVLTYDELLDSAQRALSFAERIPEPRSSEPSRLSGD